MDETWKPVLGWEDLYEVSDRGRIRSLVRRRGTRGGIMKTPLDSGARPQVNLCRDGRPTRFLVHVLVAEAFHGPRPEGLECRHLDGDATNNTASNLRWGTSSENNFDRVRHGTFTNRNLGKTHCDYGHEFTPDNTRTTVRADGKGEYRECLTCKKRRHKEQAARRKAARAARR